MKARYSTDHRERTYLEIRLENPDEVALVHPKDLAESHMIEVIGSDGNRLALIMPFVNAARAEEAD